MQSIKAVVAGSLFIFIVLVVIQLAYVFLAVAYYQLARDYPLLNEVSHYWRYLLGIPIMFLVMSIGGYITAAIAKHRVLLHCLLVAVITNGVMMYSALENMELTMTGIIVLVLGLTSTLAGGWYRQKTKP